LVSTSAVNMARLVVRVCGSVCWAHHYKSQKLGHFGPPCLASLTMLASSYAISKMAACVCIAKAIYCMFGFVVRITELR